MASVQWTNQHFQLTDYFNSAGRSLTGTSEVPFLWCKMKNGK